MILLDTHVWVRWLVAQSAQADPLPEALVHLIETAEQVCVSVVSCWEVAMLVKRGRLELPMPVDEWCHEATVNSGIDCLPLTTAIALRSVHLSDVHRDPADRFIMATALENRAPLASLDHAIAAYPEMRDGLLPSALTAQGQ